MALLTKKEFAEKCGLNTKQLSTYQSRGKVVYTSKGLVDDSIEPNISFLTRNKGEEVSGDLETLKMQAQIKKMEQEIEKLTIVNSKNRGELMPVHLIDGLFLQHNQSILSEAQNTIRDILTIFRKRRDLSPSESSEISAEFTDRLNEMMKRAADETVKSINLLVGEFSVKKGVGERE